MEHHHDWNIPLGNGIPQDDRKKMEGSGFSDVLLEANLVSSGSISGVLTGKN